MRSSASDLPTRADRLHRRRAVHESGHHRDAGRRAVARLHALVLTNAMKPMRRLRRQLLACAKRMASRLRSASRSTTTRRRCTRRNAGGEAGRRRSMGLVWLARNGFAIDVAGRRFSGEPEAELRAGYAALFAELGVPVDARRSRPRWCCSRRWMRTPTCRRSPRPAGASCTSRPTT